MQDAAEQFWMTVLFSPSEGLRMFGREKDQISFCSDAETNLVLLNRMLKIIGDVWGQESHTYSLDEIDWIQHPLAKIECTSGAINALFLYFVLSTPSAKQIQQPPSYLRPQEIRDELHHLLYSAWNWNDVTPVCKWTRKRSEHEEAPQKRRRISDQ
jgi:hypothetical protein